MAGYGGVSAPTSLKDVKMDQLGETQDTQFFSGGQSNPKFGTYTQTLRSSDVALKQSPLFGGKIGYFFSDEGYRWLGVEFETFTAQPTIKNQTVRTVHDITYIPFNPDSLCVLAVNCQRQVSVTGNTTLPESSMRLVAMAFNVVARYPGTVFQPYAGVGAGAFYFTSSGAINGRQVVPGLNAMLGVKILATEEWGLFLEGKFNRATISNLDARYGLSGEYNAFNVIAGLAYHF
ncbi:MAG: hypothetical protein U0412_14760 [Nitrospira sp.]